MYVLTVCTASNRPDTEQQKKKLNTRSIHKIPFRKTGLFLSLSLHLQKQCRNRRNKMLILIVRRTVPAHRRSTIGTGDASRQSKRVGGEKHNRHNFEPNRAKQDAKKGKMPPNRAKKSIVRQRNDPVRRHNL